MKTILFLFGGVSSEYAVSLESAQAVLTHLDQSKFRPLMVGITKDGRWLHYTGAVDAIGADRWQNADCVPCTAQPTSNPGTASSNSASRSWRQASSSAAASWEGAVTRVMPKGEPARTGLTKRG